MPKQPVRKESWPPHDPVNWPHLPSGPGNPAPRQGGQPLSNQIDNAPAASLEQALRNNAAQVEKAKGDNWKP
jgi:hypothetical protein